MRERKGQRDGAPESVSQQNGILGDFEFVEAIFDRCKIGVHQRQHGRLRAVESGQIEQGHAMFGSQRLQDGIEGMPVGKERMEDDEVATGARSYRSQGTAPGAHLLHLHGILLSHPIPGHRDI
jgi:hypothetical protein